MVFNDACLSVKAVVEDDPDYVVRRFESGRYSVNSECRRIYQRALELVEVCSLAILYMYMYMYTYI